MILAISLGLLLVVLPLAIHLSIEDWIVKMEEEEDGLYRGTDQEVHGSADPASSGDQSTGTSATGTVSYTNTYPSGYSITYPSGYSITQITQGTGLTVSTGTAAYQQALITQNYYAQAMQNAYTQTSSAMAQNMYTGLGGGHITGPGPGIGVPSQMSEASQYKKLKSDGIKMGEIVAYRCWPIKNGFLWSTAAGRAWAPGEPMKAGENHLRDGLGVYAFKEMSRVIESAGSLASVGQNAVAFGTIHLWGEIVEHGIGYRAEYAAIKSLDFVRGSQNNEEQLLKLRDTYKVKNNAS